MPLDLDAVSAENANRKLTQPLGGAVSAILTFIVTLVVVVLILSPWNPATFFGYGPGAACANVPLNGRYETGGGSVLAHMRPQTYSSSGAQLMVCANKPTLGQQTLVTLTEAPTVVLYLVILV